MIRVVVLAHLVGLVLWLGGAFASMVVGVASRREAPELFAVVARLQAAITRRIVAPGAALVLLSGLWLTVERYPGAAMAQASPWLFVMQAAGVIGVLVVLLAALPTAAKLSRIDADGDTRPLFLLLRKRQSVVGSIAGTLALIALISAVML
jgi:hypothetical protein